MGRLVTCNDQIIWKYVFGEQNSEIYRVPEEVGVGVHSLIAYEYDQTQIDGKWPFKKVDPRTEEFEADVLELSRGDIPKIEKYLVEHGGGHFCDMLRAFVVFMKDDGGEHFQFFGEF